MRGLILINGYPNGAKFYRQGERIAQELRLLGVEADVVRNGEFIASLSSDGEVQVALAKKYDFAVYLDKDKYLGRMLEETGLRLFNPISAIEACDDKMLTYLALRKANVPLIKTVPAPLCYTPNANVNEEFLQQVAQELGFPLVVKKSYGSFGAGVQLVHGMGELIKTANEFLREPHFYQQFIKEAAGRDIRVIVIGGKAVAAMERVAQAGEFRSNIELGGVGKAIQPSEAVISVAEKAAQALGLDYCGVDVLEVMGKAMICEVNSNAFFEGLECATGVNVARLYAEYIHKYILSKKRIDKNETL
jgi:ribosomal protein S6--L-glutamate ligase/gamma-F420-2:alpha-L-glutamate ligase